jgi:hypothetical protein
MAKKRKRSRRVSRSKPIRKKVSKKIPKRIPKRISKPIPKTVSKPVPNYAKIKPKWLSALKTPRAVRSQLGVLHDGLRRVRQLFGGFEAKDGYSLQRLKALPSARAEHLRAYISHANHFFSGEAQSLYSLVRPRSEAQRDALYRHTAQISPDEHRHPLRAFLIYANTRKAQVRYVPERKLIAAPMGRPIIEERLRAEIVHPVKGGRLVTRDYLFREVLGFQPGMESTSEEGMMAGQGLGTFDPWEQMVEAMEMLLEVIPDYTPQGNEAYYRLLSDRGPVGVGVPKHMLVSQMQRWGEEYETTLVELLIGVRYQGDEFKSRASDVKSEDRQAQYRKLKYERRLARERKPVRKPKRKPQPSSVRKPKRKPQPPSVRKPKRKSKSISQRARKKKPVHKK